MCPKFNESSIDQSAAKTKLVVILIPKSQHREMHVAQQMGWVGPFLEPSHERYCVIWWITVARA
jgi:hypothetical protein